MSSSTKIAFTSDTHYGFSIMGDKSNIIAGDIHTDVLNLCVSAILAVMTYGFSYSDFRYNESFKKPPLIKRVANSLLMGIGWRSILG